MVLIPVYNRTYTATMEGSVLKRVACEKCDALYFYQMTRQARGEGSSPYGLDNDGASNRAERRAAHQLEARLASGCEPVACPSCGWYQPNMIAHLKRKHFGWMGWLIWGVPAVGLFVLAITYGAVAGRYWDGAEEHHPKFAAALVAILGVGVLAWVYRRHKLNSFDPNEHYPKMPRRIEGTPPPLRLRNDPADLDKPDVELRFEPW